MSERLVTSESDLPIDPQMLCDWVTEAGAIALALQRKYTMSLKRDLTPVTSADMDVETFLLERIRRHDPQSGILSEETGLRPGQGPFTWVLDPIDGTRAFAGGLPIWGILLGLLEKGEPRAGVFYMPALGDLYWADGQTATRNGVPVACTGDLAMDHPLAYIAVGSNSHLRYDIDYPRLRSLGSTAAHLVYIACSTAVASLTRRVNLWDVAGVLPLLAHCGVYVAYFSGKPFEAQALMRGERMPEPILAARPAVWNDVRRAIHPRTQALDSTQHPS